MSYFFDIASAFYACWRVPLILTAVLAFVASAYASSRPSIIVVIADDLGWGDLSCHGNENLSTPNLDALRTQGASFDHFYVQPVCAPTRAELLTSCYAPRVGVTGVTAGTERLEQGVRTIADALRDAGYATAAFGKWHNGTQAPFHPLCRGFDTFYGFTSGHWPDYFAPMLDRDGAITRGSGFLPDDITNETLRFIRAQRNQPFFALVAFNTPHSPMQVPDRWWRVHAEQTLTQRGTDAEREKPLHTRAALAMCENLDWNVGRIVEALDRWAIASNTIVVFLSDNGPNGHRFNGGMRGIKGSTDEGGVRSPLFVRWPGMVAAKTSISAPSAAIDIGPTLAELAGFSLDPNKKIDGLSLAPLLLGQPEERDERTLFSHWAGRTAVRRGSMLLDDGGRLYDLSKDPQQSKDLSAEQPQIARELRSEIAAWRNDCLPLSPTKPQPFTVGHLDLESTQLPVRDANCSTGIRRSNRHKNSTYFTDWTSTDDLIHWDVDVVASGRFKAIVHYTCTQGDVGSLVELRFVSEKCRAKVEPEFDPPLTAALNDRFPRQEGDMKKFLPLELGEISLVAGRGKLTLQAVEIAGSQVMDLRLLELVRLD
ncbi:MAG: arylsulfatase [Planctomycetota bacterium]